MIFKAQFACSVFIYLAAAAMISAQAQSTVPTIEVIIAQTAQAQAENLIGGSYALRPQSNRDSARSGLGVPSALSRSQA